MAARLYLPAMPEAPRLARHFTTKTMRTWQAPPDAIQSAQIVVTELVTNAQRTSSSDRSHPDHDGLGTSHPDHDGLGTSHPGTSHPGTSGPSISGPARTSTAKPISLTLRPAPGRVVIEVTDRDPGPPMLAEPTLDSESGRGLILVRALSEHWGYRPQPSGGKTVYAVISTRPHPQASW